MQLRSGRSFPNSVTRISVKTRLSKTRNQEEYAERKKFQEEYKSKNSEERELEERMQMVRRKTRHLIYLNEFQQKHKHSFAQKVETILELYALFRDNIQQLIQYHNNQMKHDKRFPEIICKTGFKLLKEMYQKKRTRQDERLYNKCKFRILFVVDLLEKRVLNR
jgi:hypothetical protein